ncbi:uncharacterized protein LOC121581319 [Coregonus clupeaformis]|uniref:uncharacterized protein LOC121581319 n=1 Tax=Coregonus clupeaformis TaxID=59861 RepID=UPI001E1C6813|nr:uncharacterized protein LOC121581319 [Coregonus clupeaformis]
MKQTEEKDSEKEKMSKSWTTANLRNLGRKPQQQKTKLPIQETEGLKNSWLTLPKQSQDSCESVPLYSSVESTTHRDRGKQSSRSSIGKDEAGEERKIQFSLSLTPEAILVIQKRSLEKQMLAKQQKGCVSVDFRHRRVFPSKRTQGGSKSTTNPDPNLEHAEDITTIVKISLLNDQYKYDDVEYEEDDGDVDETVAEDADRPQRWRKKLTQRQTGTGPGGQDHPGSDSDPDSISRQALLDQRHLEAYRNMHRLRDVLYHRYSAMLREKIHTQRQEIQRRAEAAGAVTEDKHTPKLRKLTCSTLSHDNTYLRSLPQTSYYLILGLQNQLSRHGCLKSLQDQEDFCFKVNHHNHNRGPVQLQRTLQEIRKRMIGSQSAPDVMSAGWGWSQQEMLGQPTRIHVTTAERGHLDQIVLPETGRRLMPGERLPERDLRERLPERGPGERLPERGPGERLPERGPGERLPERGPGERLPERGPGERLPERGLGARLPERGLGESSAACLLSQQQEQDDTEKMFPKGKFPKFATLQPSFLKNLKTVMPTVGVEEIPEKSKRAEMTVRRLRHMHTLSLINMAVSQRLLRDRDRHSLCCCDEKRSVQDLVSKGLSTQELKLRSSAWIELLFH